MPTAGRPGSLRATSHRNWDLLWRYDQQEWYWFRSEAARDTYLSCHLFLGSYGDPWPPSCYLGTSFLWVPLRLLQLRATWLWHKFQTVAVFARTALSHICRWLLRRLAFQLWWCCVVVVNVVALHANNDSHVGNQVSASAPTINHVSACISLMVGLANLDLAWRLCPWWLAWRTWSSCAPLDFFKVPTFDGNFLSWSLRGNVVHVLFLRVCCWGPASTL